MRTEPLPEFDPDADTSADAAGGGSTGAGHTGAGDIRELALTGMTSCALMGDGAVRCWGMNCQGELGFASAPQCPGFGGDFAYCGAYASATCEPAPRAVTDLTGVLQLSEACAVMGDHTVRCRGGFPSAPTYTAVAGLGDVVEVRDNGRSACARHTDGRVSCWQLAGRSASPRSDFAQGPTPTEVAGLAGVTQLDVGSQFACAALRDRTLRCWGSGFPAAPAGAPQTSTSAVDPFALTGVVQVAVGVDIACALIQTGAVECWGASMGASGPVLIEGADEVLQVVVTLNGACGRRRDGTVVCWGPDPTHGRTPEAWTRVIAVPDLNDADLIAAGAIGDGSYCARTRGGAVRCWGTCRVGQCGDGTTGARSDRPVTVRF